MRIAAIQSVRRARSPRGSRNLLTVDKAIPDRAQCLDRRRTTIPRQFADIVVTEFGIAKLRWKNQRQRADALIAIAHPDFRGELSRAAG